MQSVITYVTGQIDFRLILIQPRLILNFFYFLAKEIENQLRLKKFNLKPIWPLTNIYVTGQTWFQVKMF